MEKAAADYQKSPHAKKKKSSASYKGPTKKAKPVLELSGRGPVSPKVTKQYTVVQKSRAGAGIEGAAIGAGVGATLGYANPKLGIAGAVIGAVEGSAIEDKLKMLKAQAAKQPVMGVKRTAGAKVETKKAPTLSPTSPKTKTKSTFQRDVAARDHYIKTGTWKS